MNSIARFKESENGVLIGTINKSKMGSHAIFRISNADLAKFKGKKYHAILTELE